MEKLKECYDIIKSFVENDTKNQIEPFESVALVETYRKYWKPEKTKIILLAESHVFTTSEDTGVSLYDIEELPGYPQLYAKFVYCLGYGEPKLTNNFNHTKRDGTWQFWKIFYSVINSVKSNEDFKPILKGKKGTAFNERKKNKINLLKNMREKGVWLVDASIVALYHRNNKPSPREMRKIIEESWENYTRDIVMKANPHSVICIGKGVYNVLEDDLKRMFNDNLYLIAQPNAHLSSEEHLRNFKKYGDIFSLMY